MELMLYDRLEMIKSINQKYDLENNAYISFSGGKDSTILHYLVDMALPNNKIPRVFINTGIEYNDIVKFVKELQSKDNRIVIVEPSQNIKSVLDTYGYPFKSKVFAHMKYTFDNKGLVKYVRVFLGLEPTYSGKWQSGSFICSKQLKYLFEDKNAVNFKISHLCCEKLKKEPVKKWLKENNKSINLTGMRRSEGGSRLSLKCITRNGERINLLAPLNDEFIEWFIKKYDIKLCKLYNAPYNFNRTGCKGCPFSLDLREQLLVMKTLLPLEYNQCCNIWKPVYDEYKRIGYRLKGE